MRKTYVGLVFVLVLILIGGIGYYYYNSTTSDSIYNSDNNVNTSSKKAVGEACTTNSECETNTCTEGYCQYSSSTNLDEATATEYTTPDVSVSDTVTSDSSTKCVEIKRYGSATVSKGSVVVYKFVYQSSSSTNPLANVGLVVSGGIGRDFYRKNSATVKPSILDGNPKYDSTKQIWTYYFTWEAENPTDNIIKNISATNELEGIVYTNSNK
ncbi:MAG: hypothetical protein KDC90_17940, partial [Ignavibacteriae bacterium]|nr:hypothetical protein [Ignavibacteriota bacterium]